MYQVVLAIRINTDIMLDSVLANTYKNTGTNAVQY